MFSTDAPHADVGVMSLDRVLYVHTYKADVDINFYL